LVLILVTLSSLTTSIFTLFWHFSLLFRIRVVLLTFLRTAAILFRARLSLYRISTLIWWAIKRLYLFFKRILCGTFCYFGRWLLYRWRTLSVSMSWVLWMFLWVFSFNYRGFIEDRGMRLRIWLSERKISKIIYIVLKLFRIGSGQLIIVRMQICSFHDHLLWVGRILRIFALVMLHQHLLLPIAIRSLYLVLLTGTTVFMLRNILSVTFLWLDLSDLLKNAWLRLKITACDQITVRTLLAVTSLCILFLVRSTLFSS